MEQCLLSLHNGFALKMRSELSSGPLAGVRVVEFAGIGPAPFCAMLLSDLGADVVRIDRTSPPQHDPKFAVTGRGRRSVALDLKTGIGAETALRMLDKADVLIEGFRPGVMEKLGLGPEIIEKRNPRLIYGRMTGWGQSGPLSHAAGHDLNYIALTGALHAIGRAGAPPPPPLNIVGDFGGGALYLAMGICAALLETSRSGRGQVIDCAITDGVASLSALFHGLLASDRWSELRAANFLDGAAPFYDTYECSDGKYVAIAAYEPQFYRELLEKLGLSQDPLLAEQWDRSRWGEMKGRIAGVISRRTREEWCAAIEGSDACFAPVLTWEESAAHPHNRARETYVVIDGVRQPNAAPRFSRTAARVQGPPPRPGADRRSVFEDWDVAST